MDPGQRVQTNTTPPRFQGCFLVVAAVGTGTVAAQTGGELPVAARLGSEARQSPGGAVGALLVGPPVPAAGRTSPLWPPGLWVLASL